MRRDRYHWYWTSGLLTTEWGVVLTLLNGHLKYPNNLDQSLNDEAADKIRKYRVDYNNRSPSEVSFMTPIPSTSDRLHSEFVRLLFLQTHRETDRFFGVSGVQSAQSTSGQFHFRRAAFSQYLKRKVGLVLAKTAVLRINLNIDGVSISSKSHSTTNPVCERRVNLLVYSLSLHRHSYIGFILAFASSIHNKLYLFLSKKGPQVNTPWDQVESVLRTVPGLLQDSLSRLLQCRDGLRETWWPNRPVFLFFKLPWSGEPADRPVPVGSSVKKSVRCTIVIWFLCIWVLYIGVVRY